MLGNTNIRVPSTVLPGYWVYIGSWHNPGPYASERQIGLNIGAVVADHTGAARVHYYGLPKFSTQQSSLYTARDAVDDWFLSLGAEVVPPEEWNKHPADKPEFASYLHGNKCNYQEWVASK